MASAIEITVHCDASRLSAMFARLTKRADLSPASKPVIEDGIRTMFELDSFAVINTVFYEGEMLMEMVPSPHLLMLVEETGA